MDVFGSSTLIIAASGTGFCRKYRLVTLPRQFRFEAIRIGMKS